LLAGQLTDPVRGSRTFWLSQNCKTFPKLTVQLHPFLSFFLLSKLRVKRNEIDKTRKQKERISVFLGRTWILSSDLSYFLSFVDQIPFFPETHQKCFFNPQQDEIFPVTSNYGFTDSPSSQKFDQHKSLHNSNKSIERKNNVVSRKEERTRR
jgi:hypothetical protein